MAHLLLPSRISSTQNSKNLSLLNSIRNHHNLKTKSFVNPNSVNLFIKIPHSNQKLLKFFLLENLKLLLGFEWGTYLISEIATTNNKTTLCG